MIRISGIRSLRESDTTELVKKIINEIDTDLNEGDIVRSHRVGKPNLEGEEFKHRQLIVRLSEPSVKFRIMKCRKKSEEIAQL